MPLQRAVRPIRSQLLTFLLLASGCVGADPPPGPPSQVAVAIGDNQQAAAGMPIPIPPAVRVTDSRGKGVPGSVVRFTIAYGGGYVTGDSVMTDASGLARVGSWVLGTRPGGNSLAVAVDGLSGGTAIFATAVAGPPAAVRVVGTQTFTELTQHAVSPPPTVEVVDAYANPVSAITVTFAVTLNSGTVTGATVLTNAQGQAQVGSWTLGSTPGQNQLTASTTNGASAVFTGTGLAGPPQLIATTPVEQSGFLAFPVTAIPRVRVTDGSGNPIANIAVAFAITGGDGAVAGGLDTTGSDGIASPGDWRLGPGSGSSTLVATMPKFAGPQLSFHATGVATPFIVDVRFLTTMSADSRDAFVAAARRWMQVIVGDIPDQPVTLAAGACTTGQPALNETIDDVVIYASVVAIDGPGNVLGSAGPCVRRSASRLTVVGSMRFDEADLALLQNSGRLTPTIVHEMGHVLGFGTSWASSVTQDIGLTDPIYIGPEAMALWPSFNASLQYTGRPIPLADVGGVGTRDSHWRESVFHAELMTGFIEAAGVPMPLSKLTIATFKDMGYEVDYGAADPFAGNLFASAFATGPAIPLNDVVQQAIFEVTPDGRVHRIP